MSGVDEAAFESFVCDWLVAHGGYAECKFGNVGGGPADFDPLAGIDTAELFAFIGATQGDAWTTLLSRYGSDPGRAQRGFVQRLAGQLDARGTVDVLRHGVEDLGVAFRLAYFKPASGITPELAERYAKNRLTVTRQLRYEASSTKTLDLGLFVNGIPVATAELKNHLTGQTVEQAIAQYRSDRDPANPLLRRAVVHFAVDTETVAMTTRLDGASTRFLPFNRGHDMGAGNPANPDGHRTAYLWERVWQRDAWLDVLQRFVHVVPTPKGSKARPVVVFPRFHQWDAVLALTAAAREQGAGHDYLVQHSAGSGKSNTIAWTAHRLSSLHDDGDSKVFDKVIVITDRRVLDKQLQDTIYQFEHVHGVVVRIDENSQQLADALAGEQARVIITTLQKFPFVTEKIESLPERTYAVIVDEAHSSQTGESAAALKGVLGVGSNTDGESDEPVNAAEDALAAAVAARGKQPNLSFFAFTATPKARTLELFGRFDEATRRHVPFHLYAMRQAIEEGFILDVLANYVTYTTFWQIDQKIPDDPEYNPAKAKAAIARFVSLHPHQLAQKAEVIIEHFRQRIASRIGGQAKAMVVTRSREHAVRYHEALRKYVNDHGYTDVGVLVAFSGTLDLDGTQVSEAKLNGIPESQVPDVFDSDEYQILVVAEKYQTGFDQPKLAAMYVDKPLTGLAAVQTLSRLNRTHPQKDQTFVLDFHNEADDIRTAFEPWYGETVAPPTDPNLLYDTRHALDEFGVLWPGEIEAAVELLLVGDKVNHDRVHAALAPAVDRFGALDDDERERFVDALQRFVRTYSFLSQVVSFTDAKLHRDYLYCRALAAFVKLGGAATAVDAGSLVELTYLRIEEQFSGSVTLSGSVGEIVSVFDGTGKRHEPEDEPLSQIIEAMNERFGTTFDPADRLFFDAVAAKLAGRADIQQQAAANSPDNFALVIGKEFEGGVIDQMTASEQLAISYLDRPELQALVHSVYAPLIQGKAKVAHQEHCPIGDLLGPDRESTHLEYKATLRTHADGGELYTPLETAVLKTIAAFLNSRDGGTLLVGIADDGSVHGLDSDYASLHKPGRDDRDVFQLHLGNIISQAVGAAAATNLRPEILRVDDHDLCRIHVDPAGFPVDATVVHDRNGQHVKETQFFVRIANGTRALDESEKAKYIAQRW